jgi:hypothetical protein
MRDIADLGLSSACTHKQDAGHVTDHIVAFDLVNNFAGTSPEIANQFFQQYLTNLLGDILYVLTDADHKSGKLSCSSFSCMLTGVRFQEPGYAFGAVDFASRERIHPGSVV